jgi:starch synthase
VRSDEDFSDNVNALFQEFAKSRNLGQVADDENLLNTYYTLYNDLAN